MSEDTSRQKRGPSDATDYSSSTAPETKQEAEETQPKASDARLHPGGAMGVSADPGMSSLDRDAPPQGGKATRQQDVGSTGNDERQV
jgi:hypothetical protein